MQRVSPELGIKEVSSKIERKKIMLTLLVVAASAAVIGGLVVKGQANAETLVTSHPSTTISTGSHNDTMPPFSDMRDMLSENPICQEFGTGRGRGGHTYNNYELSTEYKQTIDDILSNDSDVQSLVNQGYNVTSIIPQVKNIISAGGTVTAKATTAVVILKNGTSGYATVNVNIETIKIDKIVIITRTVIDKSTSSATG
jgi:hypothetical protein